MSPALPISGEYPSNWTDISAETKAAAGFRCVRCRHPFTERGTALRCDDLCDASRGRKAAQATIGVPLQHTPHDHITPGLNYGVHHFDGDKSNCRWWNLMALCNACHLSVQARVVPERQWLFEHTAWARPYIAGFYAHWCAKMEISRALAEEHTDIFLAVGQPWLYSHQADIARAIIAVGMEAAADRREIVSVDFASPSAKEWLAEHGVKLT